MKLWMDTEFHEDGHTIDLISVGIVREDGAEYYAVSSQFDFERATMHPWLPDNVLAHLPLKDGALDLDHPDVKPRAQIAAEIVDFAGEAPQWWGYYGDYDWVVLCQLYGTMMDLPKGWPMYLMDVKNFQVLLAPTLEFRSLGNAEHHALADARDTQYKWGQLFGMSMPLDGTAIEYSATMLASNHIWHVDDPDQPGRRAEVARLLAAISVNAYLSQLR